MNEHRVPTEPVQAARLVLDIDVVPAAAAAAPDAGEIVARAIRAAADIAGPVAGEVGVLVEGDAASRELNRRWRGIDKPTNVLSFPGAAIAALGPRHLGDIAISYETAAREAEAEARPFAHHLAHLAVHGFLHLLGYDHESERAAEEMEGVERKILARLDIPDPYGT